MFKYILCLTFTICSIKGFSQESFETEINNVLNRQASAWNKGDLVGFMADYWKNDSLMFVGKSGVTYGWQNTLDRYKISYPDAASMGVLSFTPISIKRLSTGYCQLIGKWNLKREKGDLQGHFTILLQYINGRWLIIADHSS